MDGHEHQLGPTVSAGPTLGIPGNRSNKSDVNQILLSRPSRNENGEPRRLPETDKLHN